MLPSPGLLVLHRHGEEVGPETVLGLGTQARLGELRLAPRKADLGPLVQHLQPHVPPRLLGPLLPAYERLVAALHQTYQVVVGLPVLWLR